jgi:hypothetical protein
MAGVGPLELSAAVHAVAVILDGAQVPVIGLDGREAYPFESASAVVTVTVHLDTARNVDQVADLLDLGLCDVSHARGLYSRGGRQRPGVYVSLYSPAQLPVPVVAVAS